MKGYKVHLAAAFTDTKECAVTKESARTVFLLLMRATFSTKYRNRKFKVPTKSMHKIQVARVKLSYLISKLKFIYTNQKSIHPFPVMHLYALQYCLYYPDSLIDDRLKYNILSLTVLLWNATPLCEF